MKEKQLVDLEKVLEVGETACRFCKWGDCNRHTHPCSACNIESW